jgi:type I restriction enzyme S subunit
MKWQELPAWTFLRSVSRTSVDAPVLSLHKGIGVVEKGTVDGNYNRTPENLDRYQEVRRGDVVVNRMKAWQGTSGVADVDGIISAHYLVFEPTRAAHDPRYLDHLLRSEYMRQRYEMASIGIRTGQWELSRSAFSRLRLPVPPLELQRRIADYLEAETSRIDLMLERSAELERHAEDLFLSTVVDAIAFGGREGTIGLYGSDYWIGAIPETWSVAPLGMRYRVQLGKMLNEARVRTGDQRPYLGNSSVRWDSFDLRDLKTMEFRDGEWDRYGVEPGDVLVCEGGEVGRAAVWGDGPAGIYFQKALHRLRPLRRSADEPRYLMYALMAAARTGVFAATSNKATIDHLTGEKLAEHRLPFAPVEDQRSIVAELDRVSDGTKRLRRAAARQRRLLAERRQALITAAVTGELEV